MVSQILGDKSIHVNVRHRKVGWWNPKLKSSNLIPGLPYRIFPIISMSVFLHRVDSISGEGAL